MVTRASRIELCQCEFANEVVHRLDLWESVFPLMGEGRSPNRASVVENDHYERLYTGALQWQDEFDRYVMEGESAIWIWAPIIAKWTRDRWSQ